MSWNKFYKSVNDLSARRRTAIWLKPSLHRLPLPIQRHDEPFFPLSKAIVQATTSKAGLFIFDFASYLATGAAGIVALERSIAYAKDKGLSILHGPFSGTHYIVLADEISFTIDAITVTLQTDLAFYLKNPPFAPFLYDDVTVELGGIMSDKSLRLYKPDKPMIDIPIIDSHDLLSDLTDTYLQSIKQQLE